MSVIRKVPYIENLLSLLSSSNLADLKDILNAGGDNVKLDFTTLTDSYKNKVTPVYFTFEDINLKTAILIWNEPDATAYDSSSEYDIGDYAIYDNQVYVCLNDDTTGTWNATKWKRVSYCVLICYHRFQDLAIYELNTTTHNYLKINEYCDINELRRVVLDKLNEKSDANTYTKTEVNTLLATKQDELLVFTNVSASTWVSDATYDGYTYKCVLTCEGITADSVVDVIFGFTEATSGNYAPVCTTGANSVTIYSKVDTTITIPTIKEI